MANLPIIDANGDTRYVKSSGAGSDGDPLIMERTIKQATHDNLNSNANMQVGNADVANGNPVPVSDAAGSLTVDQAAHDSLNGNANIQVGNVDVSTTNPVPTLDNRAGVGSYKFTTSADMSAAAVDLTNAPASGKRVCITDIFVAAEAAMILTLKEETSGTVVAMIDLTTAHTNVAINLAGRIKLPVADKKLQGQTSASGNVHITVTWIEA